MVKLLILILGLAIANPVTANCDSLLKKWAIYHNNGEKKEAKKIFTKIIKQCILAKK